MEIIFQIVMGFILITAIYSALVAWFSEENRIQRRAKFEARYQQMLDEREQERQEQETKQNPNYAGEKVSGVSKGWEQDAPYAEVFMSDEEFDTHMRFDDTLIDDDI